MVLGKELRFFIVIHRQRKETVCNIQTQESVGAIPIHTTIKDECGNDILSNMSINLSL